jgi:EAL domain-containing protein (putative c-di-GMP-specific phosphodiesterase class I)
LRAFLARNGCDEVQGFVIGRPVPIGHFGELVGLAGRPAAIEAASRAG